MMNKTTKLIVAAIVVIVIAVAAVLLMHKKSTTSTSSSAGTTSSSTSQAADMTITYDGSSFSVSPTKVKAGGTVKVVNNSKAELDFDSDPHPVHTDEPELNVGAVEPGQSKTFTVTKVGTWGFHNHLDPSQHGDLTVE